MHLYLTRHLQHLRQITMCTNNQQRQHESLTWVTAHTYPGHFQRASNVLQRYRACSNILNSIQKCR